MFNIEKLDHSIQEHLGEITDEQREAIQAALDNPVKEKELFDRLGVDESTFRSFMQSFHSGTWRKDSNPDDQVFAQKISFEELEAVTGGDKLGCWTGSRQGCLAQLYRFMYWDFYDPSIGFPNCAATVEKDSWCGDSDACYSMSIIYHDMEECGRAWK